MSNKQPPHVPVAEDPVAALPLDEPSESSSEPMLLAPSPRARSTRSSVGHRALGEPNQEVSDPGFRAANLYVERGPGAGQLIPVRQGVLAIGRASASDLRLLHPSISRHHAQLVRRGERFFLKDLGSQNGTFLNRSRVSSEVEVRPGDQLTLGHAVLRLRVTGGADDESSIVVALRNRWTLARWAVFAASIAMGFALVSIVQVYRLTDVPAPELATQPAPAPPAPVAHLRPGSRPKPSVRAQRIDVEIPPEDAEMPSNDRTASVPPRPGKSYRTGPMRGTPSRSLAVATKPPPVEATPARAPVPRGLPEPVATKPSPRQSMLAELEPTDTMAARYEGGDAAGALELARRASDTRWTQLLTRFRRAYSDGQRGLTAHDIPAAKRAFETARELDQQLSQGRGWYQGEIKRHLSGLNTLEGDRALARDQITQARDSYRTAVDLNPWNRQARTKLEALEGEPIVAAPAKLGSTAKSDPRSSAIDEAFDKE